MDVSDASGRPDPVEDFRVILGELKSFGAGLEQKPMMVAASKIDVANPDKLAKLKRYCSRRKLEFQAISAVTGAGVERLVWAIAAQLKKLRLSEAQTFSSVPTGLDDAGAGSPALKRRA